MRFVKAEKKNKWNEVSKSYYEAVNNAISQSFQYFVMCVTYAVGIHIISIGQKDPSQAFA